tara:strand:- start:110 stop:376 length:267 start_codon:yes stop_codon:yes gene_type:complete
MITILDTIKKINPDAEASVWGNDINTCKIEWHNGTTEISKADIETKMNELQAEEEQQKQNEIDKKASGKQKLKDLGLDDDEIKALMGA